MHSASWYNLFWNILSWYNSKFYEKPNFPSSPWLFTISFYLNKIFILLIKTVKASNPKIICTIKEKDPSNSHLSFESEEPGLSMNIF